MSFLSTGNSIFFYSEIFLLVETIIENWGKSIFKDEIYSLIFWIVETIFFFLSIFQRLLSVIGFFRLVETMFQQNPSFRLAETKFRANNGFRKKKEKL